MSAISSLGQSASWASASRPQPSARMKEDMLNRMDSDGSGGVSQSELDTAFADIAARSGMSAATSSSELFTQADADSDGSLSVDELDQAMQTAFAPPADTQGFVQSRGGMPPPPPMGGAGNSEATTDPLDTNGDGVVSAEELAAAQAADPMQALMQQIDSDGDGQVSAEEVDGFVSQLSTQMQAAASAYNAHATNDPSLAVTLDLQV